MAPKSTEKHSKTTFSTLVSTLEKQKAEVGITEKVKGAGALIHRIADYDSGP